MANQSELDRCWNQIATLARALDTALGRIAQLEKAAGTGNPFAKRAATPGHEERLQLCEKTLSAHTQLHASHDSRLSRLERQKGAPATEPPVHHLDARQMAKSADRLRDNVRRGIL